jgi:hypothetical protein
MFDHTRPSIDLSLLMAAWHSLTGQTSETEARAVGRATNAGRYSFSAEECDALTVDLGDVLDDADEDDDEPLAMPGW